MASVLIVDDEELSRFAVRKLLSRLFPEVQVAAEAENGRVAVELALSLKPDIVLMDIRIPSVNGIEAAQTILATLPATKIIVLSAYDSFGFAQRAINIGVSGYLLKPVAESDFATVFGGALSGLRPLASEAGEAGRETAAGTAAGTRPRHPFEEESALFTALARGEGRRAEIERAIASLPLRDLGLERVAERVGMSSQHLSRLFKEIFGVRFVEYSTSLRIEAAKAALAAEDLTVDELCRRLGWSDSAHFTKVFKERTGLTPKVYARGVRRGPRES